MRSKNRRPGDYPFLIWMIRFLLWKLDFIWAFFPVLIYCLTTLPFTFRATFYRRTKLPSRFESPAVILVVGIGLFIKMTTY